MAWTFPSLAKEKAIPAKRDPVRDVYKRQGQPFEIISDIGPGINYKKKGLQELIRRISQRCV